MADSWWEQAACRGMAGDLFVPRDEKRVPGAIARAKAVCQRCDVMTQCLTYALAHDVVGVWGGRTTAERHRLSYKIGRAS